MAFYSTLLRLLRLALWAVCLVFLAYCVYVTNNRPAFLNSFGHPLRSTELVLFGLPMLAAIIGFAELAVKDRLARLARG
jgi:hypothetical protein